MGLGLGDGVGIILDAELDELGAGVELEVGEGELVMGGAVVSEVSAGGCEEL